MCMTVCYMCVHHFTRYRKVVGDVCIEPDPSPFDILNVLCPPEPPGALRIILTDDISQGITAGQILNFSLVQTMVNSM